MTKKDEQTQKDEQVTSVPQKTLTPLERMKQEHDELAHRLEKLSEFIGGAEFASVDQEERERLKGQEIAMSHYAGILAARIRYHEAKQG